MVARTCSAHSTASAPFLKRHLSDTRESSKPHEKSPVDGAGIRPKVPHILVYALGNYPYPLSRHSLPQSVLPHMAQQYALSTARATIPTKGNARSTSGSVGNALTLMKKHDCWIGGGLVDIGSSKGFRNKNRQPVETDDSPRRAVVSLVKPRKSRTSCPIYACTRLKLARYRFLDEHRRSASPIPAKISTRATPHKQRHNRPCGFRHRPDTHSRRTTRLARDSTHDAHQAPTKCRTAGPQRSALD